MSPSHQIKMPLTFLSLAPVQSSSYPKLPAPLVAKSPVENDLNAAAIKPVEIPGPSVQFTARRHSSTGSVGSQRFLKLGPVHGGNNGEDDYAIEEWTIQTAYIFHPNGIVSFGVGGKLVFCILKVWVPYLNIIHLSFFFFFFCLLFFSFFFLLFSPLLFFFLFFIRN